MIYPDTALEVILSSKVSLKLEHIEVIKSLGRILGTDIYSPIEIPAFNKSAMDGYAYISSDSSDEFKVVEVVPAGYVPKKAIKLGECAKIMTGAMLPSGADKVIRVEYTQEKESIVKFLKGDTTENVCFRGENVKKGDKILTKGELIRVNEIATLSSIGLADIEVYKQPVVGLIVTGSELVNPGETIEPGKIYNSNGPQIYNQITSIPVPCNYYGIVTDDETLTTECIDKALNECDLVIISGGVSMGDYDFVPSVLKKLSVNLKFEQIAIKPGKPTVFGEINNTFVFGLPGNPVSTFIIFELFVKPFIYKIMGHDFKPHNCVGTLRNTIKRKVADRVEYKPIYFDGNYIQAVDYLGSAHINALCQTNAFIRLEQNVLELKEGTVINVRQL